MRPVTCEKENLTLAAARSSAWTADLREHLLECAICSDLVLVDDFLQNEAALTRADASLPDPSLIWWKAQFARRNRAMSLASRPVRAFQKLAYLGTLFAILWIAVPYGVANPWTGQASDLLRRAVEGVNPLVTVGLATCLLSMSLGSAYLAWSEK